MRLVNSNSIELEEVPDDQIPRYAILSHRWQEDEVSFQDMQSASAVNRLGYKKLKMCCDQAAKDGIEYAWVDTCCIDKTSSAELSESINSMYRWYQNAAVCYVYLFDVDTVTSVPSTFTTSAWFTRGWTLQELIAPLNVEFYEAGWHKIGTKETLKCAISSATGIDVKVLERGADPKAFSIAQRMSWASGRTTKKLEDIAYSLLGLFGVNMPLLYGEGERAFIRLQEEVMKQSADHSIFAWTSAERCYRGLLAKSPASFRHSHKVIVSKSKFSRMSYSVKNLGLKITLPMLPWAMDTYLATPDCEQIGGHRIGIYLRPLEEEDQYARVSLNNNDRETVDSSIIRKSQYKKIYVQQRIWGHPPPIGRLYGFWLRSFPPPCKDENGKTTYFVTSYNEWDSKKRLFQLPKSEHGTAGIITYYSEIGPITLKLGFDFIFNPVCQFGPGLETKEDSSKLQIDPEKVPFEAKMNKDWMDNKSEQVFKGDRRRGIDFHDSVMKVLLSEEVIDNRRVWVVDISIPEEVYCFQGIKCSGCDSVSEIGDSQSSSPSL